MRENPWEEVLDELYKMGGRGEFPAEYTEQSLRDEVDLVERLDKSRTEIQEAVDTLYAMDLAYKNPIGGEDTPSRNELCLTGEGFDFAHNRQQEKRNIKSNRSVELLTLVLAFVGMAQATALTAAASESVPGDTAMYVTGGAGVILVVIYVQLLRSGLFNREI